MYQSTIEELEAKLEKLIKDKTEAVQIENANRQGLVAPRPPVIEALKDSEDWGERQSYKNWYKEIDENYQHAKLRVDAFNEMIGNARRLILYYKKEQAPLSELERSREENKHLSDVWLREQKAEIELEKLRAKNNEHERASLHSLAEKIFDS